MIEMGKTYKTRDGREVRIYATDGEPEYPVHGAVHLDRGWVVNCWTVDGREYGSRCRSEDDLIECDPHGILPRHRELLAEAMAEHKHDFYENVEIVRTEKFTSLVPAQQVALIALARLDKEKGE